MTDHIVILTGAGISAESGLGTFRDKDGLWTKVNLEDVATPEGYARNPDMVLDFYNDRRKGMVEATANAAHHALGRLEAAWPGKLTLVTQNIDNLHEQGGSTDVIHMHGEMLRALCASCGHQWDWPGEMSRADSCPNCNSTGTVRPDVVWFGEMPYHMERIYADLERCDLFVSIGTSGNVYPAAGFVAEALRNGADTLEVNLEPSEGASLFRNQILGPATETVPTWVDEMLTSVAQ
ncbi:MAG: NAD-dependent deacylase [Pseudomonadota bacterium]